MIRQNINIADFEYICDLYNAEKDYAPVEYKEFVILRNIDFINNVSCDTDIYFLEKSAYEKIKSNGSNITDIVAFPCHNSNFGSFSKTYTDFINMLDVSSFKLDTEGGNVFSLYKFNNGSYTNNNVKIKCDKLRIYHPFNKTDLNYIIYLDNVINGIHFHYLCDYSIHYNTKSETEFIVNNNVYSEFIELFIPNVNALFSKHDIITDVNGNIIKDDNIYFNDYYNVTKYVDDYQYKYKKSDSWISSKSVKSFFSDTDMLSMTPLYLILNPFITETNEDGVEEKIYFRLTFQECNNYNSFPINITLYPFDENTNNNTLLISEKYAANSDTFVNDYYFKLVSKLGFSHGQLCILNNFDFNNKYNEITNPNGLHTAEAYAKYNGLSIEKHEVINTDGSITYEYTSPLYEGWYDYIKYTYNDLHEIYTYASNDNLYKTLNSSNISSQKLLKINEIKGNEELLNKLEDILQAYEDSDDTDFGENVLIKCCGYQIDIATDHSFSNIIATDYHEMHFIDDFEFSLANIFNDWYSIPNSLVIRIQFIDKYLGVVLTTGNILLSKEWIKYIINNTETYRLIDDFKNRQNILNNMGWNKCNAKENTFNFIDKINCIVDKSENNNINYKGSSNGVKIIYKPIFYQTQELQSINIKNGFTQNIGINLSQYMTKINIFKLVIDGNEIHEYGRNDIYVIFNIDSASLTNTVGRYSIIDESNNYISSGTYTVS